MFSVKLVGIVNPCHTTFLEHAGFQVINLAYNELSGDLPLIVVSDTFSGQKLSLFPGITLATDIRLAGFRQPLVILSFLNRRQLHQFDKFDILNDPAVYVWSLPLKINLFIKFIDSVQGTTTNIASGLDYGLIFQHRFQEIFSTFVHGKSFDLVNKITGPLRAACMLAQIYPEKKFFVCNKLEDINQHIAGEATIQRLFFITGSVPVRKSGIDNQQIIDFISLLKKLTELTCRETNIQKLTGLIDELNKAYYQLTNKYG